MRILVLSWEYPPHSVGGLARHVEELAEALVALGVEIHVLTIGDKDVLSVEIRNGVIVHRIQPCPPKAPDFLAWILQLNLAMLENSFQIIEQYGPFQLLHAHDWLVAYVARSLKRLCHMPLIATIHATEAGRHQGLHTPQQLYISMVEQALVDDALQVIVCSGYMFNEVQRLFQLPSNKIAVIPNGVRPEKFRPSLVGGRAEAAENSEEVILFIGRLVAEKGVQVLLRSLPLVLRSRPKVQLLIVGTGPMEEKLRYLSAKLGLSDQVHFTGYVDESTRNYYYQIAKVAVFPSTYEPFGIVALEGMAAGMPVVVANTGGLGEIIKDHDNGLKVAPNDPASLAAGILTVLSDTDLRQRLIVNAKITIQKDYAWEKIAQKTKEVYELVISRDWSGLQRGNWFLEQIRGRFNSRRTIHAKPSKDYQK